MTVGMGRGLRVFSRDPHHLSLGPSQQLWADRLGAASAYSTEKSIVGEIE